MEINAYTLLVIAGLAIITVLARSLFFISKNDIQMPRWFSRGLHYAPIAALSAVVAPEVLMTQGALISSLLDARLFGAIAGLAFYAWRRDVLFTIVGGMAVYLPLHMGLGW